MIEQPHLSIAAGPGLPGHPDLEDLAALADGMLEPAAAEQVRAHLDTCEDCFEIFAETLRISEDLRSEEEGEDADVDWKNLPPWSRRPSWTRWLPAAAAALLASVGGALWYHREKPAALPDAPEALSIASLAQPFRGAAVSSRRWQAPAPEPSPEPRSGESAKKSSRQPEAEAVQLGAELFHLQMALQADDSTDEARRANRETAEKALELLAALLGKRHDPAAGNFYAVLRSRLQGPTPLRALAPEAAQEAKTLRREPFATNRAYLDLGAWAAAGHLATQEKKPFAQQDAAPQVLAALQGRNLPDTVRRALQHQPPDYEAILQHYYAQGR